MQSHSGGHDPGVGGQELGGSCVSLDHSLGSLAGLWPILEKQGPRKVQSLSWRKTLGTFNSEQFFYLKTAGI